MATPRPTMAFSSLGGPSCLQGSAEWPFAAMTWVFPCTLAAGSAVNKECHTVVDMGVHCKGFSSSVVLGLLTGGFCVSDPST